MVYDQIENINRKIITLVQKVKKCEDNYDLNMMLASQGVDSLDMFDLLLAIEESFNISVDISEIDEAEWNTICKISLKISEILKGKC